MLEKWILIIGLLSATLPLIPLLYQFINWIKKRRRAKLIKIQKNAAKDSVANRFIMLFEKHGVHRNQIPRFFGHGLVPYDISSPDKLLPKLTPEILQVACDLFAVRLEWLEGASAEIYPSHHFYKQSKQFLNFITELKSKDSSYQLLAKLIVSDSSEGDYNAILIIEEVIDYLDTTPVIRYHLCDQWLHTYWKSRADLAACIAIACNQLGSIKGFWTKININDFSYGERFLVDIYSLPRKKNSRLLFKKRQLWRPEDWVFDPESFLDGVDERDFGKVNALARWLEYAQAGYMNTKFPEYANAPERFAEMLERLNR